MSDPIDPTELSAPVWPPPPSDAASAGESGEKFAAMGMVQSVACGIAGILISTGFTALVLTGIGRLMETKTWSSKSVDPLILLTLIMILAPLETGFVTATFWRRGNMNDWQQFVRMNISIAIVTVGLVIALVVQDAASRKPIMGAWIEWGLIFGIGIASLVYSLVALLGLRLSRRRSSAD